MSADERATAHHQIDDFDVHLAGDNPDAPIRRVREGEN